MRPIHDPIFQPVEVDKTGGAIDLTLGDLEGNAINLGSAFDEISEKSATRYFEQHPEEIGKPVFIDVFYLTV